MNRQAGGNPRPDLRRRHIDSSRRNRLDASRKRQCLATSRENREPRELADPFGPLPLLHGPDRIHSEQKNELGTRMLLCEHFERVNRVR